MTDLKSKILEAIVHLEPDQLRRVYEAIRSLENGNGSLPRPAPEETSPAPSKPGNFLLRLAEEIQIDAPPDFSKNWERYASGELGGDDQVVR